MKDLSGDTTGMWAERDICKGAKKTGVDDMQGGGGDTPPMTGSTVGDGGSSNNNVGMPKGDTSLTGD